MTLSLKDDNVVLQDPIPVDQWEDHWVQKFLRPFEYKMLSRRRCRSEVLEKAERARATAREVLTELKVDETVSDIHRFIVDGDWEGMAWGGYAVVEDGEIRTWIRTWLS